MKKALIISALALTVGGLGLAAGQAQDAADPVNRPVAQKADWRGHHGWHHRGGHGRHGDREGWREGRGGNMLKRLEELDTNKDGALTQTEIDQFRQDQITRFDTDKDGTLSLEEYQGLWLERMRERMVDAFQAHDDDGDGKVTPAEFNERFADLVRRHDRNGDGKVDQADRGGRHMMHGDDDDDAPRAPQQ